MAEELMYFPKELISFNEFFGTREYFRFSVTNNL